MSYVYYRGSLGATMRRNYSRSEMVVLKRMNVMNGGPVEVGSYGGFM